MQFIVNKGQWDSRVEYRGDFSSGSFFLENQGFTVVMHNTTDLKAISEKLHGHAEALTLGQPITLHSHAYTVKFLGSSTNLIKNTPDKILPA